jgi:hypothetical protein
MIISSNYWQILSIWIPAAPPVRLSADEPWCAILNDFKFELKIESAIAALSTCRVEAEDPLDMDDTEIADGIQPRAGRIVLDGPMTDRRAARLP